MTSNRWPNLVVKGVELPRRGVLAAAAGVVAFVIAALSAMAVFGAADVATVDELGDGKVSWLYSQTADGGELDDLGDGSYRLIMRGVDPHTIQFSDRPDRLVKIIDTSHLVD